MRTNERNNEMEKSEKSVSQGADKRSNEEYSQESSEEISSQEAKEMSEEKSAPIMNEGDKPELPSEPQELVIEKPQKEKKKAKKLSIPKYYCGNCEALVRKGARFCESCGHELNWAGIE